MARSTHDKQLERARAKRHHERAERQHATRIVVSVVAVLVVAATALAGLLWLRGGGDGDDSAVAAFGQDEAAVEDGDPPATDATEAAAADPVAGTGAAEPCPLADGDLPTPPTEPYGARPTADLDGLDTLTATITTTCGEVVLALDAASAPTTVENFVALADDGYYDGVVFHRVVEEFMVQGGDPTGTGTGCLDDGCEVRLPGYTFDDELALAEQLVADEGGYPRGTLAMANAGADTNGSQFFIVQSRAPYPLPPQYAAFGEVVSGMEVVDRIAAGPAQDQYAIDPVTITGVDVQRCAPAEC